MKRRKIISIAVCLCLLLTMAPAAAFAAESQAAAESQTAQEPTDKAPPAAVDNTAPTKPAVSEPTASEPAAPIQKPAADTPSQASPESDNSSTAPADNIAKDPTSESVDSSTAESPAKEPASQEPAEKQAKTQAGGTDEQKEPVQKTAETAAKAAKTSAVPAAAANDSSNAADTIATVKKTASGITVTGGTEGTDWVYDSANQTLTITKNGLTVGGTATADLSILCTLAVTAVTMDNLNNGNHLVALLSGDPDQDALSELTITIKGKNQMDLIVSMGDITLTGTSGSRLDLTIGTIAIRDLDIKNAAVNGGLFMAGRDLNIKGNSRVTAKPTKYLKDDLYIPARLLAGRDLNINLSQGGKVTAKGSPGTKEFDYEDQIYPMMAGRNIHISKGSNVVVPGGGYVGTTNLFGIVPVQVILNANGTPAPNASVQYGGAQTAAMGITQTASPQTGDSSDTILPVLYLILLAAGLVALLMRKRQN